MRWKNNEESAIPLVPPSESHTPEATQRSWRDGLQGCRFGIFSGALITTLVFLINLITTAVIASRGDAALPNSGGKYSLRKRAVLYQGDCGTTNRLDIGIHLLINILSTLLLSSSNYAMQCLSAPTREEVDQAHRKRKWLEIGAPGLRNLKSIGRDRLALWFVLLLSSLPLHLL